MNKEFVPHEPSLALKELGFDEPCLMYFSDKSKELLSLSERDISFLQGTSNSTFIKAPLYQQAFRWFREKYGIHQNITQYYGERFYFKIEDMFFPRRCEAYPLEKLRDLGEYVSQEEAELACLIKLIEIVKQQEQ
jgi:hypothetical protein